MTSTIQQLKFLRNLEKSFGNQENHSGGDVYVDDYQNRKLGRVGQPYPKGMERPQRGRPLPRQPKRKEESNNNEDFTFKIKPYVGYDNFKPSKEDKIKIANALISSVKELCAPTDEDSKKTHLTTKDVKEILDESISPKSRLIIHKNNLGGLEILTGSNEKLEKRWGEWSSVNSNFQNALNDKDFEMGGYGSFADIVSYAKAKLKNPNYSSSALNNNVLKEIKKEEIPLPHHKYELQDEQKKALENVNLDNDLSQEKSEIFKVLNIHFNKDGSLKSPKEKVQSIKENVDKYYDHLMDNEENRKEVVKLNEKQKLLNEWLGNLTKE